MTPLELVSRWRYPGLFGLLLIEESGVPMPVPGDWAIVALGALTRTSGGSLLWTVLCAVVAVSLGGSLLFTLARGPGRRVIGRIGRRIGLHDERRARLERWLQRRGAWALIGGRLIPGARVALTATAGAFGMDRVTFTLALPIAATVWSASYFALGYTLGSAYESLAPRVSTGLGIAGAVVILVGVLALVLRARRRDTAEKRAAP